MYEEKKNGSEKAEASVTDTTKWPNEKEHSAEKGGKSANMTDFLHKEKSDTGQFDTGKSDTGHPEVKATDFSRSGHPGGKAANFINMSFPKAGRSYEDYTKAGRSNDDFPHTGKNNADSPYARHSDVDSPYAEKNTAEDVADTAANTGCSEAGCSEEGQAEGKEAEVWQAKYAAVNDAHLRLMAEFDNFRKRTMREKAELIKAGGESILTGLLPVVDDLERAMQNIRSAKDLTAVSEGMELIYAKFNAFLSQQGVKRIETTGLPFDTETSEAIATMPVAEEEKGKVIDCTETGYTLHERVLRHAKVVVGE